MQFRGCAEGNWHRRLLEEDINYTIPAVVCAIIGIQALKRDKLDMLPFMLPLIATFASGIATTLPALLALCRSMKLYPAHRGYVNNVSLQYINR
ncbi:hypothetical protein J3E68DRAFT_413256 [Trichoderma sp. SZMC 28012]